MSLYDRLSRWYDLLSASERPLGLECAGWLGLRAGEWVLEIGPGSGHALAALARGVAPGGLACGLDRSAGMLGVARARLSGAGLDARLCMGDAAHLPYADGCFDAVFASFTLELFDETLLPVTLAEIRRVLRPGGRLAAVALLAGSHPGPMARLYNWAHRRFPRAVDCRPIDLPVVLQAAGLRISRLERRWLWGLPVAMALSIQP